MLSEVELRPLWRQRLLNVSAEIATMIYKLQEARYKWYFTNGVDAVSDA